jgi:tetratricopeptide (TPR) repeat protein
MRALGRAAASDLDAVVLKALAKAPAERYPSAEAMRSDLGRWAEHRPVEAQVPTVAYRARRFVLRHRLGVSLATAAVGALLLVTGAAIVLGLRAHEESLRAVTAREFVQDMFRVADPDRIRGDDITARNILERGRVNAERMFAAQPVLLAEVLSTIGDMQVTIGDHAAADGTLQRALTLFTQEGAKRNAALGHAAVAINALFLGDVERATRSIDAAEKLSGEFARDDELRGRVLYARAWVLASAGQHAQARDLLLQAGKRIDAWNRRSDTAVEVLQALAEADQKLGNTVGAAAWIDEAQRRADDEPGIGPRTRAKTERLRVRLGLDGGRYGELVNPLAASISACDRQLGSSTEECLILRRGYVVALLRTGRVAEARDVARQLSPSLQAETSPRRLAESLFVIAQARGAAGEPPDQALTQKLREVAVAANQSTTYRFIARATLSEVALLEGNAIAAVALADEALASEAGRGVAPIWQARAAMLQGLGLAQQGRHAEAIGKFDEAHAAFAAAWGREHPRTVLFRLNAVASLRALSQQEAATRACADASKVLDSALGAESPAFRRITGFCSPATAPTRVEHFL